MMLQPMKLLPNLARAYAKDLCQRVGMCAETLLTAWTHYAQIVERLPLKNAMNGVTEADHLRFLDIAFREANRETPG